MSARVLLPDGTTLRRAWLREALNFGWTPLQARYLCRAAEKPNGRYDWAPPGKPSALLESERLLDEQRTRYGCVLERGHKGEHVYPTRKPIGDRYADGEFRDKGSLGPGRILSIPGVTVPGNRPLCRSWRIGRA